MKPSEKKYKLIKNFATNTDEGRLVEVLGIFKVSNSADFKKFNPENLPNKKLLWHGSRASNFSRILKEGLLIAPPDVPHTAFLFGKGIYFTDFFQKAASYCKASTSGNKCLILLSEVAMGNPNNLSNTDSNAHNLPEGFHSVQCLGIN